MFIVHNAHLPCLHNAEGVTLGSPRGHFFRHFSTFFGLFRGCPRSVPMTFRHHRKVSPQGFRGVLGQFFRLFSDMFGKVPRYFSSTPGWFLSIFGKIGSGGDKGEGGLGPVPYISFKGTPDLRPLKKRAAASPISSLDRKSLHLRKSY